MHITVIWHEPRFMMDPKCYNSSDPSMLNIDKSNWDFIWIPDVQIDNLAQMEIKSGLRASDGITVAHNGTVIW